MKDFEILGDIVHVQTIAVGPAIRDLKRLQKMYGKGRWQKLKGTANVRLRSGRVCTVELHWYEAHGYGRKEIKRKLYFD